MITLAFTQCLCVMCCLLTYELCDDCLVTVKWLCILTPSPLLLLCSGVEALERKHLVSSTMQFVTYRLPGCKLVLRDSCAHPQYRCTVVRDLLYTYLCQCVGALKALPILRESLFSGMEWTTGLLEWTTGMQIILTTFHSTLPAPT